MWFPQCEILFSRTVSQKLPKTSSPAIFLLFSSNTETDEETEWVSLAKEGRGRTSGRSFQMDRYCVNPFHGEIHTGTFSLISITMLSLPSSTPVYQLSFLKEQYWYFFCLLSLNYLKLILNLKEVSKYCLNNGFLQPHILTTDGSAFPDSRWNRTTGYYGQILSPWSFTFFFV